MMGTNGQPWPFKDPPNVATITTVNIIERGYPILLVTHDLEDGGWQFLCGQIQRTEDARLAGLGEMVDLDPTIAQLADLPLGGRAWRESAGAPWTREPKA